MSCQKGNGNRTRSQKYKNRTAFKNDLHDKTPKQQLLNSLHISEVCQHCKGVIEWKIKYKKYKPLTQPKTCTRCQQRNIRKAYHVLCRGCALETRVCAKCLKNAAEVEIEPPQPTTEEELKLKVEMDRLLKSFPERKRRAFLRYMEKGKKMEGLESEELQENDENDKDDVEVKPKRIPYSREELLQKLEKLKINIDDDEDDYDSDDEENDNDDEDNSSDDSVDDKKK